MDEVPVAAAQQVPWNKGKLVGQKPPLRLKEIWAIRIRLQLAKKPGNWRCTILRSTASFAAATS